jgi:hypothetical protein
MHYANAAGLGKGKMRAFPLDRKTKAWFAQGNNNNPKYKMAGSTPTNHHERENRTKNKDVKARSG